MENYTEFADMDCPYCGTGQNVDREDWYGFGEKEDPEQECSECGKVFRYTVTPIPHYETKKLPEQE